MLDISAALSTLSGLAHRPQALARLSLQIGLFTPQVRVTHKQQEVAEAYLLDLLQRPCLLDSLKMRELRLRKPKLYPTKHSVESENFERLLLAGDKAYVLGLFHAA